MVEFFRWQNPMASVDPDALDDDFDPTEHGWPTPYRKTFASTPMGIVPLDHNRIDQHMSLCVAHTDQPVTPSKVDRAKRVPGVEMLKPLTRYRVWLGVARLFDEREVKRAVAAVLDQSPPQWALVRGDGPPSMVRGPTREAVTGLASGRPLLASSWGGRDL